MSGYSAGSVTATITLETKQFNEAIGKLKAEVQELENSFNNIKGGKGVTDDVKQLKEEMDSLKKVNDDYRRTINNLRKENERLGKGTQGLTKDLERYNESVVQVDRSQQKAFNPKAAVDYTKSTGRHLSQAGKELKAYREELEKTGKQSRALLMNPVNKGGIKANLALGGQFEELGYRLGKKALKEYLNEWANATIVVKRDAAEIENAIAKFAGFRTTGKTTAFKEFQQDLKKLAEQIKQTGQEFNRFSQNTAKSMASFVDAPNFIKKNRTELELLHTGFNQITGQIVKVTEVLKTFNFALLEGVDTETIFYQRTVQLASAMQRLSSQGTQNWKGRGQFGYSQFLGQSSDINSKLGIQTYTQVDKAMKNLGLTTDKTSQKIYKANERLGNTKGTLDTLGRGMQYVDKQALRARYGVETFKNGVKVTNTEVTNTNGSLKNANNSLKGVSDNARKSGKGITSFNNGIVQTAHSGRILSNTLYQIRGALLSLKMIFTAMGGMMLWGFAMDIAESVKETVTAKNEMEAQLNQNSKVDASGIQYFRKELDKLTGTFKKVNKYTVGETVSSIGLEFNLTAKQMADALPIVTMVQSEYVRAGRKTSEAALAVKDILQGEFQRLSRETGVGKEELIAYGWDEDKTNIDGLLKALKKAAEDRHWDVFAKKATSLNDVLEISKSRFSELGADVVDSVTPLIVGAFNTIIDSIEGLSKAFNSMGSFGQNFTLVGGGVGALFTLGTALPMITKGMGLAEIATLGWKKALGTAVLNLNKAEVAQYGFRKALAAVITGTKASELATVSSTKAIFGRLLGVNQTVLAERGLISALVHSKATLKGQDQVAKSVAGGMGTLYQKLIYLSKGEIVVDKKSATLSKTLKSLATSTRLWSLALTGVISIGIIAWLASVAAWADTVKKRVEAYNDVLATGKDKIKEYTKDAETYQKQIDKLKAEGKDYSLASRNKNIMEANKEDMNQALILARHIKKQDEEITKNHQASEKALLNQAYAANGVKNIEKYGQKYMQMKAVQEDIVRSENERSKFEYASLQHINEHVDQMKKAGIEEKQRIKYITEYSTKAEEAANHLKQFNQGDVMAGVYYLMDRASLMWIDLWNDKDFIVFWNSVKKTFNDLKPTLNWLKDTLLAIGRDLLKFFSTQQGQIIGGIALVGLGFAAVAKKLGGVVGKVKGAYDGLKTLGGKLKDIKKGWKDVAEEAEEATGKMGGETSTGGINGDTGNGKSWGANTWSKIKDDATNYARAAVGIAAGMLLISEAILMLNAPMGALAATGIVFKQLEPNIRKGIDGLKLVAPTMLALLPPVIALSYVFGKFNIEASTIARGAGRAAVGIAAGLLLVTEAILLLNLPLLSIASLGYSLMWQESAVRKGAEAMKIVGDSLQYLLPFVPVFIGGIAIGIALFSGGGTIVGGIALAGAASGIAIGLLLVSEAILMLKFPLAEIANLGKEFSDLTNVRKGADALKLVADAMNSIQVAMTNLTIVKWDLLASAVADLLGRAIDVDLTDLTGDGGFFSQLETFTKQFNELKITPINQDNVTALNGIGAGLESVGTALKNAKTAIENLPPELKQTGTSTGEQLGIVNNTSTTTSGVGDIQSYFDQLKEPLRQLKTFIDDFNTSEEFNFGKGIDSSRVEAINQSATMLDSLNTAVTKVKDVLGNIAMGNVMGNIASLTSGDGIIPLGGIGAIGGLIFNTGGSSGDYVSSLGSQFQEMENIIKDMTTFSNNINGLGTTGSGNANVDGLATFVQQVTTQINNLKTTITNAVPQLKTSSKGLGAAIGDGLKEGFNTKIEAIRPTFATKMKTLGSTTMYPNFKQGIDKMSEAMGWELYYVGQEIDNKKAELGDKAYALGQHMSDRFKEGNDMHSPGIMARSVRDEMSYIGQYLQDGINNLPQMAFNLANSLGTNFNFDLNLGNFQFPDITQWTNNLTTVIPTVANLKTQVSTNFEAMRTNVSNSFTNIVGKTRSSLLNMQSATTKNIGNIKTSWRGMQDALIASAEHIRSQTSSKINKLKANLGEFWNKVKHPDQLIQGVAGGQMGSIRRRNMASKSQTGNYAGGELFKPARRSRRSPSDSIEEYLKCLLETGSPCYAGGWNFNWTSSISKKFKSWNTHFGKYGLDDFLNVGKFENSNFPVKNNASVAKRYIFDVISSTSYAKYFNSHFGDNPVAALLAGAFNCWDGTNIVLALARAFGFEGSRSYGSWNGVGHVWASIPGLGIIDPTAIQQRGSFTAPGAVKYAGGSIRRGGHPDDSTGNTNNYNTNVEIHVHGDDVEVNKRKIDKRTGKQLLDILGINPATGR